MSSSVKTFLILMFIPFLLAAGHDIYLNYFSDNEKILHARSVQINPENFLVSDLGWVLYHYIPKGMDIARDTTKPETWEEKIDPILRLPTMVIGLIPFIGSLIYSLLAFVLGIWPFSHAGQTRNEKESDFAVYKHAKETKYSKK